MKEFVAARLQRAGMEPKLRSPALSTALEQAAKNTGSPAKLSYAEARRGVDAFVRARGSARDATGASPVARRSNAAHSVPASYDAAVDFSERMAARQSAGQKTGSLAPIGAQAETASTPEALMQRLGALNQARVKKAPPAVHSIKKAEMLMRVSLEAFPAIAELGFLNLFQMGRGGGEEDQLAARFLAEKQLVGKRDLPLFPLSSRPKYGYLNIQGVKKTLRLPEPRQYGDVVVGFRPEVEKSSSFYIGDSLLLTAGGFPGKMYRARPMEDRASLAHLLRRFTKYDRFSRASFVELELHRPDLGVGDIAFVVLPSKPPKAWAFAKEKQQEVDRQFRAQCRAVMKLAKQHQFDVYGEVSGSIEHPASPSQVQTSPVGRTLIYKADPKAKPKKLEPPSVGNLINRAKDKGLDKKELIPILALLSEKATTPLEKKETLKLLKHFTGKTQHRRIRRSATLFLGQLRAQGVVDTLATLTSDEDAGVRTAAVLALTGQPKTDAVVNLFHHLAGGSDMDVNMVVALQLAETPSPQSAASLLKIAKAAVRAQSHPAASSSAGTPATWSYFLAFEAALALNDTHVAETIAGMFRKLRLGESEQRNKALMKQAIAELRAKKLPDRLPDAFAFVERLHHWAEEGHY